MSSERKKIVLGTAQFGLPYGIANSDGQVSRDMVGQVLDSARNFGITTLDTAIAYGDSETVLGHQNLQGFSVISKLFEVPKGCSSITDWVEQQLIASLKRLQLESLDALLLHRPAQLLESSGQELYQTMIGLKERGLVKRIGISMYEYQELHDVINAFDCRFDIVQAPMNIIDRRIDESGLLSKLKNAGIEVHARSAFLQGLLLIPQGDVPAYFKPWATLFNSYHNWLNENNISALQACLGYLNQHPDVDKIIVGMDNLQQLKEIVAAIDQPSHTLPDFFQSVDEDLINPSRWAL